jgi:hypothetical protein
MENSRSQLLERLQTANNILVTVSSNPSVDQLAAAIGLTLMLNKVGKQGTAVFSGKVPSTIEFLQPDKTIEKNTDSLRDFIIALDKSKADKLRYKVEDNHVKIFITPYRTAISEKDLQFSQGDFNVEVVIALGVKDQKDLDRAITAHGRILHDATTISVTNGEPGTVGAIDWDDSKASSLSEMVASLASDLGPDSLDGQIATALMTGIVSQTERFRNARTSPATMSIGSALMAAGANQQLIATKLEQAAELPLEVNGGEDETPEQDQPAETESSNDASALQIEHEDDAAEPMFELPAPEAAPTEAETPAEPTPEPAAETPDNGIVGGGSLVLDPPTLGGKLSANTEPEHLDPPTDPLSVADSQPVILERQDNQLPAEPVTPDIPAIAPEEPLSAVPEPIATPVETPVNTGEPLAEPAPELPQIEVPPAPEPPQVAAPTPEPPVPDVSNARDAVSDALASIGGTQQQPLPPISALNAQPFDINDQLGNTPPSQPAVDQDFFTVPPPEPVVPTMPDPVASPIDPAPAFTMPDNLVPPAQPAVDATAAPTDAPAAPPVPPPFMPNVPGFDPSVLPAAPSQPAGDQQPPANPQV